MKLFQHDMVVYLNSNLKNCQFILTTASIFSSDGMTNYNNQCVLIGLFQQQITCFLSPPIVVLTARTPCNQNQ